MQRDPSLDYHGNASECGRAPRRCLCLCVLLQRFHYEKQLKPQNLLSEGRFCVNAGRSCSRRLCERIVFLKRLILELASVSGPGWCLRNVCRWCESEKNMNVSKPTAGTWCPVGVQEKVCIFLILDVALNSHSAALMLPWQPAPMGHAIKTAPFLYSCILWTLLASTMNKTSVSARQIQAGNPLHEDFRERFVVFFVCVSRSGEDSFTFAFLLICHTEGSLCYLTPLLF